MRTIKTKTANVIQPHRRVLVGPCNLDGFEIADGEIAACYLDPDAIHGAAHWVVGGVYEVVAWLLDEAAVSPRRRALIAAIGLRQIGISPEFIEGLEYAIVRAIDEHPG